MGSHPGQGGSGNVELQLQKLPGDPQHLQAPRAAAAAREGADPAVQPRLESCREMQQSIPRGSEGTELWHSGPCSQDTPGTAAPGDTTAVTRGHTRPAVAELAGLWPPQAHT